MELDMSVARLKRLAAQHKNECYAIERKVRKELPDQIKEYERRIQGISDDMITAQKHVPDEKHPLSIMIRSVIYQNDTEATKELIKAARNMDKGTCIEIGEYRGFKIRLSYDLFYEDYQLSLMGRSGMKIRIGAMNALKKLEQEISRLPERKVSLEKQLEQARSDLEAGLGKMGLPFAHEEELRQKSARLEEVDKMLERINRGEQVMEDPLRTDLSDGQDQRRIVDSHDHEYNDKAGKPVNQASRDRER